MPTALCQIQSEKPRPQVRFLFSHHRNALVFMGATSCRCISCFASKYNPIPANVAFTGRVVQLSDYCKFRLRHGQGLTSDRYFPSPVVRGRVGPTRTADTAEWRSTGCRTVIFSSNGMRVAPYSSEAAFT